MAIMTHLELVELANNGIIENCAPSRIGAASIDVTLASVILVEIDTDDVISLRDRRPLPMRQHDLSKDGPYDLQPGEFILAATRESFNLTNDVCAQFFLNSSGARIGLGHMLAGFCDPGWVGSVLTLELKNENRFHPIRLHAGDRIGQVVFHRVAFVPDERSYSAIGNYNGDLMVQGARNGG